MIKRVQSYIDENGLLSQGERVLCALSGGADSVCLLSILLRLKNVYGYSLAAVHVNHCLRGAEAERDAEFCVALCEQLGVKLHMFSFDVKAYALQNKLGIEAAAREVRYMHFDRLCKEYGYTKIAVAHNAQDNAETVLMHLMRGSGLDGLRGILPQRGNIIRPLLCLARSEIEEELRTQNMQFVTDSTNLMPDYNRNRVRHELLPMILAVYNPNFVSTLSETSYLLSRDADYLNTQAQAAADLVLHTEQKRICVDADAYLALPEAVALRVMKIAIARLLQKQQDIPFDTVKRCHRLCVSRAIGKRVDLPDGCCACMEHGRLLLGKKQQVGHYCYGLQIGESVFIAECGASVTACVTHSREKETKNCVFLDIDKIKLPLCVRNRRSGDRVQLNGMTGTKKLQDYFVDEKVAKQKRDYWPLVCSGDEILWICAKRKSGRFETDESTRNFLKLTYEEREQ